MVNNNPCHVGLIGENIVTIHHGAMIVENATM